jgi:hypothetical protein
MKARIAIWITLVLMLSAGAAHANEFNVKCSYSHTLPDDPIVYPGKPGQAMVHEFFGNPNANAYSTYDSLSNNKVTTCDSNADVSSYWVPQLRRASGVIAPAYQKTYYKNDQPVVPIQAIPPGLEMLAGNHMGTAPNVHINFLCRGGGYTTVAPTNCPVVAGTDGTFSQLDISVHFPDCWDGKTLVPILGTGKTLANNLMKMANGTLNVGYRNADGTCPAGYPVKIPELQLNVAYMLGQDPDLSTAQLSMDPVLTNGVWVAQWGGLYTAHGDFFNAWKPEIMQYMVDTCMNLGTIDGATCSKSIPTYYSKASANVRLDSSGAAQPAADTLLLAPGDMIFIKFPSPMGTGGYPYAVADLQTQGQNVTDKNAIMMTLDAATTDWDDSTHPPTSASCNTSSKVGGIYLDDALSVRLNDVSSYIAAQVAAGVSQIGICIRNTTPSTVQFSSRTGAWAPGLYLK